MYLVYVCLGAYGKYTVSLTTSWTWEHAAAAALPLLGYLPDL